MKKRFRYSRDFQVLKDAIISRNSRRISNVLRRQPHLALSSDPLGNNAIHWCVITRQQSWIKRFVEHGTPIDAKRADGQTPVLLSVNEAYDYWYRGNRGRSHPTIRNVWVILGQLLAYGAHYSMSAAAAAGDQERIQQLVTKDASLAWRLDSSRVSPLSHASREGYVHLVDLLLKHGAKPNMPEELAPQGRALFEACGGNHLDVADLLLRHGANPNAGVDSSGCCLTIVKYHHPKSCKPMRNLLRQFGAHTPPYDMNIKEMKQALRDQSEVIYDEEFLGNLMDRKDVGLLESYLKLDASVPNRMQVYGGITYPKSPTMVRMLLDHGLDPNRPDWLGKTFLHACAENGDTTVAKVLLDAGADINARETEFKGTPLAAAVRHQPSCRDQQRSSLLRRKQRMVKFLLTHGAATNLTEDESWATPLAWARKLSLPEVEAILVEHGAER